MGENDGGVLIPVQLEAGDAEKEFGRLSKKAVGLEEKLARGKAQLKAATDEAARLGGQLDAAKAKLAQMEASGTATADQLKMQAETVGSLQARFNTAAQSVERITPAVEKTTAELATTRERAAQLAQQIGKGGSAFGQMGVYAQKVENRLKRLATRVLFFSVFIQALRSLRSWFADVIKTDKDAVAAIAQLKGALLTLVQPIVGVVIPAFTAFVNVLSRIVAAMAAVVSSIFGTTVEESAEAAENLNKEKKALDGVGASAKKAGKSLASFDEINKIGGDSGASSGGSSGTSEKKVDPNFSGLIGDDLTSIEALVSGALLGLGAVLTFSGTNVPLGLGLMAAGAMGLAAVVKENWGAISEALQGPLGVIAGIVSAAVLVLGAVLLFSGADVGLGFGLLVMGAAGLATTLAANWSGLSDDVKMAIGAIAGILSVSLLVLGASLFFSGANIPLGLGLMVAGAVGLASSIAANWGIISELLQGPIGAITGILGVALLVIGGTLLFSGANIPLGLGLLAVGAAALGTSLAANWNTITEALQGPIGVITTIVSAALLVLGAVLFFSGANIPLGLGLLIAGGIGLAASIAANWDAITGPLGGSVNTILAIVSGVLLVLGAVLLFSGANIPFGLGLLIAGGVGLATAVAPHWDAILVALKGAWDSVKEWWNAKVAKYFTLEYWADLGSNIISGLLNGLKGAFETVKGWAKSAMDFITGIFGGGNDDKGGTATQQTSPSVSSRAARAPSISAQNMPHFAKGAVIPANREFAAVLGDQTHGNNLEGPEDLFRKIVREESGAGGMDNAGILSILQQILDAVKDGKILMVDDDVFARVVHEASNRENSRQGMALVTVG